MGGYCSVYLASRTVGLGVWKSFIFGLYYIYIYENSNELIVLMSACYIMLTLSEQIEIYSISSYYSFVLITIHSQSASESIHTDLTGHGEKIFRRQDQFFLFVF